MSTKSTERKTDSCKAARTYQLNNLPLPLSAKNNHVDQAFYPVEGLNDFYRVPKVLEILRCSCDTCKIDREYFPKSIGAEACGEKVVQAGVRLFALLVHIGHPALILGFAQKAYNVIEQPSTISDHDLTDKYWATYHRKAPDDFRALVREFQSYKNQFEAPVLDGIYQELGPDAILPFANEKRIGNGSYGTVYRFDIPQYHCQNFPESSRPAWNHTIVRSGARQYKCVTYARKELSSERYEDFWRETENLLRVRDTLNGEHIVSILKAYRRGDKFSILFPYANMNLKQFLEERDTEHRGAPLELDELWLQVLGISEALSNIAERNDRDAQSLAANNAWFGCHFDLKPANILIFGNGVWKIADFGQAAFRARRGTDSNMTNEGGSDPYSAPETDIKEQSGPRYDVWSLGCIILEVTAFLVIGRSGLIGPDSLGMARTNTPPRAKGSNSRLWQRDVGDTFILKPKVEEFMQRLGTKLPPSTPSSRFLQSIIELIKEMLTPEASSRRDANGVVQEMRHIIATTKQGEAVLLSQSPMYDGEQRMGRDLLWDLRFWHFRRPIAQSERPYADPHAERLGGDQQNPDTRVKVKLHLYKTEESEIRVDCVSEQGRDPTAITKSKAMFVPVYAYSSKTREYRFHPHFYISALDDPKERSRAQPGSSLVMQGLKFAVSTGLDQPSSAIAAQSAFTEQRVLGTRSFRLKTYKTYATINLLDKAQEKVKSKWKGFAQRRRDGQPSSEAPISQSLEVSHGIWMQIWCEDSLPHNTDSDRQQIGRIRRIVIFDRERTIFILRMQVELRMRKKDPQAANSDPQDRLVVFEPTKPHIKDVFKGSVLCRQRTPSSNEEDIAFPGIPLDPNELRKAERRHEQNYNRIDMEFESQEDACKFQEIYLRERKAYSEEKKPQGV